MNLIKEINKQSEILFLFFGFLTVIFLLFLRNNIFHSISNNFLTLVDLPLILFSLLFSVTSFYISFSYRYSESDGDLTSFNKNDFAVLFFIFIIFFTIAYFDLIY